MLIDPKTITVFLDASPSGIKRTEHAIALAQRWRAHLIGVHVVSAGMTLSTSMSFVRGDVAIVDVIAFADRVNDEAEAASVLMGEHFRSLCAASKISGEFHPVMRGNPAAEAILTSFYSDLVIVGHPEPCGLPYDLSSEGLLFASSAPLLIVPNAWEGDTIGDRILVGWNASPQARRAVSDAMAFLVAANSVRVLVVDGAVSNPMEKDAGVEIAQLLLRHGARVEVEKVDSRDSAIAQVILDQAMQTASDLLVVGAYSHARLRELLFGGTTRSLLAKMAVPVLLSR